MFRKFLKKPTAESDLPTESDLPAESDLLFKDATKDQLIDSIIKDSNNPSNSLFIYLNKNQKLISLDFSKKY